MKSPLGLLSTFLGGLLAASCLCYSAFFQAPVNDEFGHLYAGLSYWQNGDAATFNVNPPLLRSIAALPGRLLGLKAKKTDELTFEGRYARQEFSEGRKLFIQDPNKFQQALSLGRLFVVAVSMLGGAILFFWAKHLLGSQKGRNDSAAWVAGCVAAGLWYSQPQILSHGALITGDVFCAVCMLATLLMLKWTLSQLNVLRSIILGMSLGLTILAKFTGMVLLPIVLLAFAWSADRYSLRRLASCLGITLVTTLIVLPIPYAFEGFGSDFLEYDFLSGGFSELQSQARSLAAFFSRLCGYEEAAVSLPIPVAEQMLLGLDRQQLDFEIGLPSYAAGIRASHGWWWFYMYSMLVKLPLGTWLAIVAAALGLLVGGRYGRSGLGLPLLTLGIMLVATAAQDGFAQQHRYILPAYPPLFLCIAVLAGRSLQLKGWPAWPARACLAGLVLTILSSALVTPHWLSAFNWIAGGNSSGYRCLFNDASDWGQDTYRVASWIDKHKSQASVYVHSTISGHDELAAVGAQFEALPPSLESVRHPSWIVVSKSDLALSPDLADELAALPIDQFIGGTHIVYRCNGSDR